MATLTNVYAADIPDIVTVPQITSLQHSLKSVLKAVEIAGISDNSGHLFKSFTTRVLPKNIRENIVIT